MILYVNDTGATKEGVGVQGGERKYKEGTRVHGGF